MSGPARSTFPPSLRDRKRRGLKDLRLTSSRARYFLSPCACTFRCLGDCAFAFTERGSYPRVRKYTSRAKDNQPPLQTTPAAVSPHAFPRSSPPSPLPADYSDWDRRRRQRIEIGLFDSKTMKKQGLLNY